MNNEETRVFWDEQAATFDDEADHGLANADTRQAWASLLESALPHSRDPVIDLGCGTGSISMLLAERGHHVLGLDLSPKMIEIAREKAHREGLVIDFVVGDVLTAEVPVSRHAAVISRHLLWAVPEPAEVVARWAAPLADDGVFLAIEGVWNGAGTTPERCFAALRTHFEQIEYIDLARRDLLWGKTVSDQRYSNGRAGISRHCRPLTLVTRLTEEEAHVRS